MTKELKCPNCNSLNIYEDDCYNTQMYGDTCVLMMCGHCMDCKATLQWDRVYKFVGYKEMEKVYFYCPVNGWDCPYWKKNGTCAMVDEGLDPVKECDDAATFWNEDDDYLVHEGEEFEPGRPVIDTMRDNP